MTETNGQNLGEAAERYTIEIRSLNTEGSVALRDYAMERAREIGLEDGFVAVYSRTGMEQATQALGSATPLNVTVAKDKIKTVLATGRSTRLQRIRMENRGQSREDFGGELGSLFGGGVAIFADRELTQFVGAMAYSGGNQEQDEEVCRQAVDRAGLYTDVSPQGASLDEVRNAKEELKRLYGEHAQIGIGMDQDSDGIKRRSIRVEFRHAPSEGEIASLPSAVDGIQVHYEYIGKNFPTGVSEADLTLS